MDELMARMHNEFTISEATQARHNAFAVFQMVSGRITFIQALGYLQLTVDDVRPFVADWNRLSATQINPDQ